MPKPNSKACAQYKTSWLFVLGSYLATKWVLGLEPQSQNYKLWAREVVHELQLLRHMGLAFGLGIDHWKVVIKEELLVSFD